MQVHFKVLAIAAALLAHIVVGVASKNLNLEGVVARLEKMFCKVNPKYGNMMCNIKPKSRYDASMNANITLIRSVTALKYHCTGYYQFSNNEYRPMLIDIRTDYCAFEAGTLGSVFQNVFKKIWRNKTNVFQSCPISPGFYYLRDWNLAATDLPSIIPAGRYLLKAEFFAESDEFAASTSTYFRIDNHGILDLNVG